MKIVKFRTELLHSFQGLSEGKRFLRADDGIVNKEHSHKKYKKQIPVERHREDSPRNRLMDQVCHKDRQKSPGDGGAETDITVDIKGLVAVIPVADFEKTLHHISGYVLQSRGTDNAGDIGEDQAVLKRERYP